MIIDPSSSLADFSQWDLQDADSGYSPVWTTLPSASKACRILLKSYSIRNIAMVEPTKLYAKMYALALHSLPRKHR